MCGLRSFDDHLDCRIIVVEKIGDDCWILVRYMGHSQWFPARVWMFLVWVDANSFFWKDRACDRRLARPNRCYIHHTGNYRQYCYVRNKASDCKLGLIYDSDWAGDTKSISGKVLFISKAKPSCQISWPSSKHTTVSHSSTEAEVIFLDAGLRMEGLLALTLGYCDLRFITPVPFRHMSCKVISDP